MIVLEGVDRAGKTTQCQKLVQALQQSGRAAEIMRFPGENHLSLTIPYEPVCGALPRQTLK